MPPATRGILVIPKPENRPAPKTGERPPMLDIHSYNMVIGTYTKGMHARGIFLISSPEIRKIIQTYHFKDGHPVGSANVEMNMFKQANMNFYHPTMHEPIFQTKGIGDHLDLLLEKHFAKLFPKHLLYLTREASRSRIRQWEKRGRKQNEGYTFNDAWKQTRAKVIQNTRKNRPPARRNH